MARTSARAPRGLARIPVSVLEKELTRRERAIHRLQRRYRTLVDRAGRIEAQIVAEGGSIHSNGVARRGRPGAIPGRRRARNEMNLVQALARVLKGKEMGVTEVSHAVQRAGYRTTSPNFRTIVNQALINSTLFRRVSRGKYTAK